MKPLLPTLRAKKRYVVYELLSEKSLSGDLDRAVTSHLRRTLGLWDSARAGIIPVRYDRERQQGILRVSSKAVDKVKASLLLLTTINGTRVIPRVRGVSGILKKTERFTG